MSCKYMQVAKHWLFHDGCSFRIVISPLICSANQWFDLCIIETSVMKDSRRSSSTYTESLLIRVVKHNFVFVFLSGFFFMNIHDSQDSRWRGRLSPHILSTTSIRFTILFNNLIFSWVHQLRLLLTLTFIPLPYLFG